MKVREYCYHMGMGGCYWKHNEECIKPKGDICPYTCTKSVYPRKKKEENSMTQEEINKIIHLAKIAFCESCGCGIPRDTCISLGTCNEHDAFARILREKLKEGEKK